MYITSGKILTVLTLTSQSVLNRFLSANIAVTTAAKSWLKEFCQIIDYRKNK